MKRICIDLSAMNSDYKGGVNTYVHGILSGISKVKTIIRFNIVCTNQVYKSIKNYKSKNINFIKVKEPPSFYKYLLKICVVLNSRELYYFINNLKWQKLTNICDKIGDITYIPTTILNGYNGLKPRIISIHDIQHMHYPENFRFFELRSMRIAYYLSAKYSHTIQASSEFIKKDLLKNYNFLKKKFIPVIREGIDINKFRIKKKNKQIKILNNYLFYPAQLWPHKDHITVLKAFNKIKTKCNLDLIFTGAKLSSYKEIKNFVEKNKLNDRVKVLGLVKLEKLKLLYKNAHAIIIAAKYESSSLPILEASCIGVPVIASNTEPNLELGKHLKVLLFKVSNFNDLKKKILKIYNDKNLKSDMIFYNKKKIKRFEWINVVNQYIKYFNSLK